MLNKSFFKTHTQTNLVRVPVGTQIKVQVLGHNLILTMNINMGNLSLSKISVAQCSKEQDIGQ